MFVVRAACSLQAKHTASRHTLNNFAAFGSHFPVMVSVVKTFEDYKIRTRYLYSCVAIRKYSIPTSHITPYHSVIDFHSLNRNILQHV